MKRSKSRRGVRRVRVSADGVGVVSHAGVGMLREVADLTGLIGNVTEVLADTYQGPWVHEPGRVFADLAVAVADGADCVSGIDSLVDQQDLHGPVASLTTTWRLLDERIDAAHLSGVKTARATARAAAWAAGAAPKADETLVMDVDASISLDYSDRKENAAATWKHTFGFHSLLVFADRTEIASGEALAGKLRPGNAGSNTTCDHIEVLTEALASIPRNFRPRPGDPDSPSVLIRSDSAGATYGFAKFCREVGVGFSFGFAVREPVRDALGLLADAAWLARLDGIDVWYPTINADGTIRDGAWVAEATGLLDLSEWPAGSRVILRKERPHPGAQLTFGARKGCQNTKPGASRRQQIARGIRRMPFCLHHKRECFRLFSPIRGCDLGRFWATRRSRIGSGLSNGPEQMNGERRARRQGMACPAGCGEDGRGGCRVRRTRPGAGRAGTAGPGCDSPVRGVSASLRPVRRG